MVHLKILILDIVKWLGVKGTFLNILNISKTFINKGGRRKLCVFFWYT